MSFHVKVILFKGEIFLKPFLFLFHRLCALIHQWKVYVTWEDRNLLLNNWMIQRWTYHVLWVQVDFYNNVFKDFFITKINLVSQTATQRTRHSFGGKTAENADPLAGLPTKQFGLGMFINLIFTLFHIYTFYSINQYFFKSHQTFIILSHGFNAKWKIHI